MANSLGTNPIVIDTFGADVTVTTKIAVVHAMYITGYTSAKTVTFIDNSGNECFVVEVPSGGTLAIEPSTPLRFTDGFIFDDSASDLAEDDFIFIF